MIQNFEEFVLNESEKWTKKKQQDIMMNYNLFDCKLWTKPADYTLMNNMKNVFRAYANNFGQLEVVDNAADWYFDDTDCVSETSGKTEFSVNGMTNAEIFVKLYYHFNLDKTMPKLKEMIIDKAENGDSYYQHNENVQEFAKLFKKGR